MDFTEPVDGLFCYFVMGNHKLHIPLDIILLGQKTDHMQENQKMDVHKNNLRFLYKNAYWRRWSPFALDRHIPDFNGPYERDIGH